MPLPKIKHSIHEFKVPSTDKKLSFRQFLVREEKILLMAKSSEDPADIFRAVKQIVNNCCLDEAFDVDKLTIFDLEYLFLKLRAVSVSNQIKVSYRDNDDQQVYDFEIDLDEIEVDFPAGIEKVIKITDTMGIKMKWAAASIFDDKTYFKSDSSYYELVLRCIDMIYDGEDIYDVANYTLKEVEEFLDDCSIEVLEKIQKFMASTPRLYHKITYTNANGKDRAIELTSLTDFFTLG
jgi:hypothetical protein